MIGFYNYTVILTYLSLVSASSGIIISLSGNGHPYIGGFFLLICGLCDAFDGKIARIKTDRSQLECNYGIQIDSLSDIVAFGVLPAAIGSALLRGSPLLHSAGIAYGNTVRKMISFILFALLVLYILAALIRLAYFNVTEEERQRTEGGIRKFYMGLPVTSAALVFPAILLINFIIPYDIMPVYFGSAVLLGFAFLSKIQIKKPGLWGTLLMIGVGAVEFFLLLIARFFKAAGPH